jgi:hypothetical protein
MLPVASLAGSAFGRRLSMEAAGVVVVVVVVGVGKGVAGTVKVGDRVVTKLIQVELSAKPSTGGLVMI